MANELYIHFTPPEPPLQVTLDSGLVLQGPQVTGPTGRADAHLAQLPPGTATQGAVLEAAADGRRTQRVRGILWMSVDGGPATFQFDDFGELEVETTAPPEPPTPPTPEPDPTADPLTIIQRVYDEGAFDLSTKEGNGQFTEAACTALHDEHSPHWGHIAKSGAQNQYNGHAVDAIMTLYPIGSVTAGGYDIILNSVSPDASPTFHYAGGPDVNLWYYPAAPAADAALTTELVAVSADVGATLHRGKTRDGDRLATALFAVVDRLVRRRAK